MNRYVWVFLTLMMFTAVSCQPAVTNEENNLTTELDADGGALNPAPEANPDVFPRSTLTPPPVNNSTEAESAPGNEAGYPLPTAVTYPEGYTLPTPRPQLNDYPEPTGELIWILKPVGEQCAEAPTTPDLQTAVADMVAFGIPVAASETTDLPVCSACGCPTSAHFRFQIDAGFLANAEILGWFAESE